MELDPCDIDGRYKVLLETLHRDLHALCQPLTALQCVLELGRMGGSTDLLEAVDGGLAEARRMFAVVSRMRTTLRAEDAAAMVLEPGARPLN
jgi:hypothetical protein